MNKIFVSPDDDLQHILDTCPDDTTIYVKSGVYNQKLVIRHSGIKIIGENRETTKITYSDYAKSPHSDGREYNTFRTFTVCVVGENAVIENITIENANTKPEEVGQCVALSVNAKFFTARNVDLRSTQDTLFTAPFPDDLVIRYSGLTDDPAYYDGFIPRDQLYMEGGSQQVYKNCRIYGTVDFIFGGAEAYFIGCELISVHEKRGTGFVAAPCHSLTQDTGYVFYGCNFLSENADDDSVYLARPWRDFGKCEFVDCKLGGHIKAELFDKWNDTYRDKTARFLYHGLSGRGDLTPVPWSKQLTPKRANDIINTVTLLNKKYFGE